MKTIILSVLFVFVLCFQVSAASAPDVNALSAHEKSLWEAIKNGDMKTFSAGTSDELLDLDAMGMAYNKADVVKVLGQMKMTDYSLTDFQMFMLNKDAAVLTYKSTSTAEMEGKSMTLNVLNSTTYVNQGGKWLPKFHTETVIPEQPKQ